MWAGLLLGVASGVHCLGSCLPAAFPFFSSTPVVRASRSLQLLLLYLLGRLLAYGCLFGIMASCSSIGLRYIEPHLQQRLLILANVCLGAMLLASGIVYQAPAHAACRRLRIVCKPGRSSLYIGFFSSLTICPPLWAAVLQALGRGSVSAGAMYFMSFFIGTTFFYFPLAGLPLLAQRQATFRLIGRLVLLLMGIFLALLRGLLPLLQGGLS